MPRERFFNITSSGFPSPRELDPSTGGIDKSKKRNVADVHFWKKGTGWAQHQKSFYQFNSAFERNLKGRMVYIVPLPTGCYIYVGEDALYAQAARYQQVPGEDKPKLFYNPDSSYRELTKPGTGWNWQNDIDEQRYGIFLPHDEAVVLSTDDKGNDPNTFVIIGRDHTIDSRQPPRPDARVRYTR